MTFYLSLSLPFSPSEVLSSEQDDFNEETKKTFSLIEIEEEEDIIEDNTYSKTEISISSESKGNILRFLVELGEFNFQTISNLMEEIEDYGTEE